MKAKIETTTPPAASLNRLVRRKRPIRYRIWTDEDGPMQPHKFGGGCDSPARIQRTADWWARELDCYVQLIDRKGMCVASAGRPYDAPNAKAQRPPP